MTIKEGDIITIKKSEKSNLGFIYPDLDFSKKYKIIDIRKMEEEIAYYIGGYIYLFADEIELAQEETIYNGESYV